MEDDLYVAGHERSGHVSTPNDAHRVARQLEGIGAYATPKVGRIRVRGGPAQEIAPRVVPEVSTADKVGAYEIAQVPEHRRALELPVHLRDDLGV
ncbi:MAG TPA: hypothetical protein VGI39_17275 [Polyangiaceae bacterium]